MWYATLKTLGTTDLHHYIMHFCALSTELLSTHAHTVSYSPHSEMHQQARLVFRIKFVIWTVPTRGCRVIESKQGMTDRSDPWGRKETFLIAKNNNKKLKHLLAPKLTPTHSLCCIDGEIFSRHLTLLVRQATLSLFGPEKKHMDPRTLTLSCGRPCFGSSCTSSSRHYTLSPTPASKTCKNVHDKNKVLNIF